MHLLRHAPGAEFIAVIAACGVGGWLLGRWLGRPVLGGLLGFGVGFAAGLWRLIRQALEWQRQFEEDLARRKTRDEDASP
jgi:F0F1-type ATP synthase assembly protein I